MFNRGVPQRGRGSVARTIVVGAALLGALVAGVAPAAGQDGEEVPTPQFETPTPVPPPPSPTPRTDVTPSVGSIGVAPISLSLDDVLRGSPVGTSLLVRNGTAVERPFEFTFSDDGSGAADWLTVTTFDDRDAPLESVMLNPTSELQVRVEVDVPEEVANGTYVAVLDVTAPGLEDGTVGAGISVNVTIEVTGTQRLEGTLVGVTSATEGEVGLPVQITANIENTGNVILNPVLDVTVTDSDGAEVDRFSTEGMAQIDPAETRGILAEWDTTTASVGVYTIAVSASVDGLELGSGTASVELAPRGTLTRSGSILSMELVQQPDVGGLAQIRIEIQNSGQIESTGTFNGQLTFDGAVVETVVSPPRFIPPGEVDTVDVFVTVAEEGDYRLAGTVNFEGFDTDEAVLEFTVGDGGGDGGSSLGLLLGVAAAVVVLGGAALVLVRRRRA